MQAQAKKKPRVLLLGAGNWGMNYAKYLSELGVLAGIIDPVFGNSKTLKRGISDDIPLFETVDVPLSILDFDCAIVAAPAKSHFSLAKLLLSNCCSVLLEKPMTANVAELEELYDIAKTNNLVLLSGHLLRHHSVFCAIRQKVRSGVIAGPLRIFSQRLALGKVRGDEGVLRSFGCHDISLVIDLIGELPTSAKAVGLKNKSSEENVVTLLLEFSEGHHATILLNRLSPFKRQELLVAGSNYSVSFDSGSHIHGNACNLVSYAISDSSSDASTIAKLETTNTPLCGDGSLPLSNQIDHFLDLVAQGKCDTSDEFIARSVLQVVEMVQQ